MLNPMLLEKRPLSVNEIEAQTALVLPERETPALVVIGCVGVCTGDIKIRVQDVNVATQVCAIINVEALNALLASTGIDADLTCTIKQ